MSETKMEDVEFGAESTEWTRENLEKLLASLKNNIPENEKNHTYIRGLKAVDWDKVAFPPFSAQECQQKWNSMMVMMRQYRSLPELLDEAEAVFSHRDSLKDDKYVQQHVLQRDEYSRKKFNFCLDNHLPLPRKRSALNNGGEGCSRDEGPPQKPPPHGRALFLKELSKADRAAFGGRLLTVMGQRWKEMSENEKQKYNTRCEKMKREYNAKLIKYLDQLDEEEKQRFMTANRIKSLKKPLDRYVRRPGEPTTPARSGFIYFFKEQSEHLSKDIPQKERMDMARKLWYGLSAKEKSRYDIIIQENLEKYKKDLQSWFQTLTPEQKADYLKRKPSKQVYLGISTHVKKSHKLSSDEEEHEEDEEDEML